MKILMVTSDLSDGGGVNRVISNLSHILLAFPTVQVDILHAKPITRFNYPMPRGSNILPGRQFLRNPHALNLLLNLLWLRPRAYDYVLSFWTQENIVTATAFLGSKTRRILSEHFCHDQSRPVVSTLRRWLYRTAHKVLVLNTEELRYYRSLDAETVLMPNPVVQAEQPVPASKENLIIGVGHLIERKGFVHFIEACVQADIAAAGWRAAIIGQGPDKEALQRLIDRHQAAHFIQLVDPTPDIEHWYKRAKVILVPSLSEVFSMVIPEAMAFGVVPLAFAADGPKEILRHHPAHLAPVLDVAALAEAIRRTMQDGQLEEKSRSFKMEAMERYSFDAISARWKTLLGLN